MRQVQRIILILITCLVLPIAAKTVSGSISEDTNWSGEILVDGNIIVERGVTLTIKPGTKIKFVPKQHPREKGLEFIVFGKILARGEEGSGRIHFTSASNDKRMHDWYGIVFKSSENYSELKNCVVEYAYSGIRCIGSSPIIYQSTIQYNYYSGINCEVRSHPQISLSRISQNGMMGIHCELYSNPVIEGCEIRKNANGIAVYDFSLPDLGHVNPEEGQSSGKNQIFDNFDFDVYNHSQNGIMSQNNFWRTEDPEQIRGKIYDRRRNAKYGSVSFLPLLDKAPDQDSRERTAERIARFKPTPSGHGVNGSEVVDNTLSAASIREPKRPARSTSKPQASSTPDRTPKSPTVTRTPVKKPDPIVSKPPVKKPEPIVSKPPAKKPDPIVSKPPAKKPEPVVSKPPVKQPDPIAAKTPTVKTPDPIVSKPPVKKPDPIVSKPPAKKPDPIVSKPPAKKPEPVVSKPPVKKPDPIAAKTPPVKKPDPIVSKPPVKKPEPVVSKPAKEESDPIAVKTPPVKKPEPIVSKPPVKKPDPIAIKTEPVKESEPIVSKPPVKKPEPIVSTPKDDIAEPAINEVEAALAASSHSGSSSSAEKIDTPPATPPIVKPEPELAKEAVGSNGHSGSDETVNYSDFLSEVQEVLKADDSDTDSDFLAATESDNADEAPYLASSDRGAFPDASRPSENPVIRQQDPYIESMLDGGQREYLRRQAPDYPRIHLKSGAEGNVLIEVIVGRDGRLKNYRILRSDGQAFTDSAIRALKKYRYKTGTVGGVPVNFRIVERFEFKLGR